MLSHLYVRYAYLLYIKKTLKYKEYELIKDFSFRDLPDSLRARLIERDVEDFLRLELPLCAQNNISLLEYNTNDYPLQLKNQKSMPPCLYVKGHSDILHKKGIAIVGSRKASSYGIKQAYTFAKNIAQHNTTVISGLAYGIDTKAHEGCLDGGGFTIAVVGNGLDRIYPISNTTLHNRIINQGCVVSEFPLHVPPNKYNFPVRNRIISGLASSVVIVEASEKSGALITVDYALDQGKEVYAIPGNIDSPTSKGTNKLIKNGAALLDSLSVLFPEEELLFIPSYQDKNSFSLSLNALQKSILSVLSAGDSSLEDLLGNIQEPIEKVLQALSYLEMIGLIRNIQQKYTLWK